MVGSKQRNILRKLCINLLLSCIPTLKIKYWWECDLRVWYLYVRQQRALLVWRHIMKKKHNINGKCYHQRRQKAAWKGTQQVCLRNKLQIKKLTGKWTWLVTWLNHVMPKEKEFHKRLISYQQSLYPDELLNLLFITFIYDWDWQIVQNH